MKLNGIKITWLGHSTFLIETPGGKKVIIDPWVTGNPATPAKNKSFDRIDVMLCTHGHSDHVGDAAELAKKHNPTVVAIYELCLLLQKKGAKQIAPMNKGGSQKVGDIKVTMVNAFHSSGFEDGGSIAYVGDPAGYVIEFENGIKIYHAGDTCVWRYGDHPRTLSSGYCHAADRRSVHDGGERGHLCLPSPETRSCHPHALRHLFHVDWNTRGIGTRA